MTAKNYTSRAFAEMDAKKWTAMGYMVVMITSDYFDNNQCTYWYSRAQAA